MLLRNGEYIPGNDHKMEKKEDILSNCQISEKEFENLILTENFNKYLRIFSKNGEFCIMEEQSLYTLLDDLLVLINAKFSSSTELTLGQILEANDGIIRSIFGPDEILFGLKHI